MNCTFSILTANDTVFKNLNAKTHLGIELLKRVIEPATPNTSTITIPGSSRVYDMSEVLAGHPTYKERKITLTFACMRPASEYPEAQSVVAHALNGRRAQLVFDDDPAWCYEGRMTVKAMQSPASGASGEIVVEMMADPFRWQKTWKSIAGNKQNLMQEERITFSGALDVDVVRYKVQTTVSSTTAGKYIVAKKRVSGTPVLTLVAKKPVYIDQWLGGDTYSTEQVYVVSETSAGAYYDAYWKAGVL